MMILWPRPEFGATGPIPAPLPCVPFDVPVVAAGPAAVFAAIPVVGSVPVVVVVAVVAAVPGVAVVPVAAAVSGSAVVAPWPVSFSPPVPPQPRGFFHFEQSREIIT